MGTKAGKTAVLVLREAQSGGELQLGTARPVEGQSRPTVEEAGWQESETKGLRSQGAVVLLPGL